MRMMCDEDDAHKNDEDDARKVLHSSSSSSSSTHSIYINKVTVRVFVCLLVTLFPYKIANIQRYSICDKSIIEISFCQ